MAHGPGCGQAGPGVLEPPQRAYPRPARLHHVAGRALGALADPAHGRPHGAAGQAQGRLETHCAPAGRVSGMDAST
eukprot:307987-Pyramimonas_sp.AAC.1